MWNRQRPFKEEVECQGVAAVGQTQTAETWALSWYLGLHLAAAASVPARTHTMWWCGVELQGPGDGHGGCSAHAQWHTCGYVWGGPCNLGLILRVTEARCSTAGTGGEQSGRMETVERQAVLWIPAGSHEVSPGPEVYAGARATYPSSSTPTQGGPCQSSQRPWQGWPSGITGFGDAHAEY